MLRISSDQAQLWRPALFDGLISPEFAEDRSAFSHLLLKSQAPIPDYLRRLVPARQICATTQQLTQLRALSTEWHSTKEVDGICTKHTDGTRHRLAERSTLITSKRSSYPPCYCIASVSRPEALHSQDLGLPRDVPFPIRNLLQI